ncbi:zona pellucida sperm-binding protein 3-like isoform X2 [Pygocentrus nattereri]|uniref:zona pellucida sperm-binding protein 3-like isoform X2 n=1 Tax=Pygocentrus nattereri TaxID=42514 RepID=UPI00081426B8|nr:zona pellucida sperm-binding protein 3-like isoform X2 [Pygocentrus nattereri]
MELVSEMFKLLLLLTTLVCLDFGVRSADPPGPDSPQLYASDPHYGLKEPLDRPNALVRTVFVTCYPTHMEVRVKADLFGMGMTVDPADLCLGANDQCCRVTSASDDEYIIPAVLMDCGTQQWVTEEALIYTNLLIYSPAPSLDGLVRMEGAVIPVECHYKRKVVINSEPVLPTWIPHQTTVATLEKLHFTLRLMTSDWLQERGSGIYFLGDKFNIEEDIYSPQMDLRVFIDSCVATTTPDSNSAPRYAFIDEGCLVDGPLTGSKSYFRPRVRPGKLQLQLDAFKFHEVESTQIYITCTLKAYPLNYVSESMSKACSLIDGRWRSADGDDWTCGSCKDRFQSDHSDQLRWEQAVPFSSRALLESGWRSIGDSPRMASGSEVLEQRVSLGPLSVVASRNKLGMMVPASVNSVPHFPSVSKKRPIPHHSLWENGEPDKKDLENEVTTDTEELELTDSEADGAPVSEPTETPTPFTTTSEPFTEDDESLLLPTVSSPERDTTTVKSLDVSPAADELDTDSNSPVYPYSSTSLHGMLLESKADTVASAASEGHPEGLQKRSV